MSQRHSNSKEEKLTYKDVVCYGYACSSKATDTLKISAGKFGTVSLNLCSACQKKFK